MFDISHISKQSWIGLNLDAYSALYRILLILPHCAWMLFRVSSSFFLLFPVGKRAKRDWTRSCSDFIQNNFNESGHGSGVTFNNLRSLSLCTISPSLHTCNCHFPLLTVLSATALPVFRVLESVQLRVHLFYRTSTLRLD